MNTLIKEMVEEMDKWIVDEELETGGEIGQSSISDKVEELLTKAYRAGVEDCKKSVRGMPIKEECELLKTRILAAIENLITRV